MPHSIKCSFHFHIHGHNSVYGPAQIECEAKLVNHLLTAWLSCLSFPIWHWWLQTVTVWWQVTCMKHNIGSLFSESPTKNVYLSIWKFPCTTHALSLGFILTYFTLLRVSESNSLNWHRRGAAKEKIEWADRCYGQQEMKRYSLDWNHKIMQSNLNALWFEQWSFIWLVYLWVMCLNSNQCSSCT